jgi:hypothetical protein
MKRCGHCGTTILFGGVKEDGLAFCNAKCHQAGAHARTARDIPDDVVVRAAAEVAAGNCPVCSGPGPVDVFTSHRVFSAVVVTSWQSLPRISCRGCATKAQIRDTLFSTFLGWWGIPWGFLLTPVQIFRNLAGLTRNADGPQPSALLQSFVRASLAARGAAQPAAAEASLRRAA